jgi:hypothetical protein
VSGTLDLLFVDLAELAAAEHRIPDRFKKFSIFTVSKKQKPKTAAAQNDDQSGSKQFWAKGTGNLQAKLLVTRMKVTGPTRMPLPIGITSII